VTATASLRVVHTVAHVPAVDVLVGGQVVIPGLAAGQVSGVVAVPDGPGSIAFRVPGSSAGPARAVVFAANDTLNVLAIDSSNVINPWVLTDTGAVVPAGKTKLRVAHFADSAPAIDVWRSQPDYPSYITVMFPFAHRAVSPYLQSDPGAWRVLIATEARDAGGIPVLTDTLFLTPVLAVAAGQSRTVVVVDQPGGGVSAVVLTP
jgi:hypothetical protein